MAQPLIIRGYLVSIGYACLTIGVRDTDFKSCMLKNVSEAKLIELIGHNLHSLEKVIDYNLANRINLFRISSDLIPFGSSPANPLPWEEIFSAQLQQIGLKIKQSGMRVSMHPGQYTVLNSPDAGVVSRAMEDLTYHARVLDSLGTDAKHKIVLHIGGVYNDKEKAINRFISHCRQLDPAVKRRLVLENDDRSYSIEEVLEIGTRLKAPVVFDNLHHAINPSADKMSNADWIKQCQKTWQSGDGRQKIHYSQQNKEKKPGSHSDTIEINEFMHFYDSVAGDNLDIMLEVKDKNLSALKCINCTAADKSIKYLEKEWSRYKYTVLERSPAAYQEIRRLLRIKTEYPALAFYTTLEAALQSPLETGHAINAAQHVWGYFKDVATANEKEIFLKNINHYQSGNTGNGSLKKYLWKMAVKYRCSYLLDAYYFIF